MTELYSLLLVCEVLVHIQVKYPKFRSQDPSQHHWKVRSFKAIFGATIALPDFPPDQLHRLIHHVLTKVAVWPGSDSICRVTRQGERSEDGHPA